MPTNKISNKTIRTAKQTTLHRFLLVFHELPTYFFTISLLSLPLWLAFVWAIFYMDNAFATAGLAIMLLFTQYGAAKAVSFANKLEEDSEQVSQELKRSQGQLDLAMKVSNIGIWDWSLVDNEAQIIDCIGLEPFFNDKTTDMREYIKLMHVEDYSYVRRALASHLKGKTEHYQVKYRIRKDSDSRWRWFEDTGRAIEWDDDSKVTRMIGTRREITQKMKHEEDLRWSSSLFNHSPDGVFVMDPDFVIKTANPSYCAMLGNNRSDLTGRTFSEVSAFPQIGQVILSLQHKGKWEGEMLEKRMDGEHFPFKCQINAIYGFDNKLSHYICIGNDLTLARRTQVELDYLSNFDKLTGLANRSHFHQVLIRHLNEPTMVANSLALIAINLDRFQSINIIFGWEIGDVLLKDVAARLNCLDTPATFHARLGGDEFVILAEFFHNHEHLCELLEQVLTEVSRPYLISEHELSITASIGVSILNNENRHQLLNQANTALNQARFNGGNNYQFFNNTLQTTSLDQLQMEKSLRLAVSQKDFSVYYQPKLNLKTYTIDSVEALVRWKHPTLGLVPPEHFIPIAENIGLINDIGQQVLNTACRECSLWRKHGIGDIRVSVNLSSQQLRNDDFHSIVANALEASQLPNALLELELTETVLMENIDHSVRILNELHATGIRIALDDFGTGYSSLSYLQKLPLDVLKIDKSFVQDIANVDDDSAIIKAIIAMGNNLNMEVVAEGVEHYNQMKFLENQKCHYAQVYLISRPLPAAELLNLLRHYNFRTEESSHIQ